MPTSPPAPRRHRPTTGLALALVLGCPGRPSTPPTSPSAAEAASVEQVQGPAGLDELRLLGLLDALSSDALGGRYTLHDDIHRAAELIVERYRDAGVAPAAGDDHRLAFDVVVGVDPGPRTALALGERTELTADSGELLPRAEGGAGRAEGPLVFVGYGIVQGEGPDAFDELAGLELSGAIAIVLEGAPRQPPDATATRTFGRRDRALGRKLQRLAEAGVAGVIVVDDPAALERGSDRSPPDLPSPTEDHPMRIRVELPVLQVHARRAQALLRPGGRRLGRLQREIDRMVRPRSVALGGSARLVVDAQPRVVQAPNILAMVPGTDQADEIVLVTAHYDHIGTDAEGHGHCRTREADPEDAICNGADDNASGSAIVAELAQVMTAGPAPRRSVVFAHFAGEELGLLGSRSLAARLDTTPPFAGRRVVAVLNIDMVGRLRDRLTVSGVGSSEGWMPLLDDVGPHGMRVLYDRSLTQRSDHAPFYERDIPALFFFTELHADYHAPGDEMAGILSEGLLQVAGMVAELTWRVADGVELPFTPPRTPEEGLVRALPGKNPQTIIKIVEPDGSTEGGAAPG